MSGCVCGHPESAHDVVYGGILGGGHICIGGFEPCNCRLYICNNCGGGGWVEVLDDSGDEPKMGSERCKECQP